MRAGLILLLLCASIAQIHGEQIYQGKKVRTLKLYLYVKAVPQCFRVSGEQARAFPRTWKSCCLSSFLPWLSWLSASSAATASGIGSRGWGNASCLVDSERRGQKIRNHYDPVLDSSKLKHPPPSQKQLKESRMQPATSFPQLRTLKQYPNNPHNSENSDSNKLWQTNRKLRIQFVLKIFIFLI